MPVPSSAKTVGVLPMLAVAVNRSLNTNSPLESTYTDPYSESATVCIAPKDVRAVPGSACKVV